MLDNVLAPSCAPLELTQFDGETLVIDKAQRALREERLECAIRLGFGRSIQLMTLAE